MRDEMIYCLIMAAIVVALCIAGCALPGADMSDAKAWCKDKGGLGYPGYSGNPINFICGDGSKWKRPSHKKYDFEGWTKP